jgi:WD40 repeat protein
VSNTNQQVVFDIAFSPDGQGLATVGFDGTAKIWSISGALLDTINTGQGRLSRVAFASDGRSLGTYSSDDNTTKLWDLNGNEVRAITTNATTGVVAVAFGPDGLRLATIGAAKDKVDLWDASDKLVATIDTQLGIYSHVAFSPDGRQLATIGQDGKVKLWDSTGKLNASIDLKEDNAHIEVGFGPDRLLVATALKGQGKVNLWDAHGNRVGTLAQSRPVAFSHDGHRLATIGPEGKLYVWDLDTLCLISTSATMQNDIYHVAFSADGQKLAAGGFTGTVQLWDLKHGSLTTIFTEQGIIDDVKFSPDGRLLVTCSQLTDRVKFWDARGNLIAALNTGQGNLYQVAFSPDGGLLATGIGRLVKLWQIGSEKDLVIRGCSEISAYLHNPRAVLSDSNRHLCDGFAGQK